MGRDLGPLLVAFGLLVVLVGVLAWSGWLAWFGHLPGDIRIEGENVRVYIPWGLHARGLRGDQCLALPGVPLPSVIPELRASCGTLLILTCLPDG